MEPSLPPPAKLRAKSPLPRAMQLLLAANAASERFSIDSPPCLSCFQDLPPLEVRNTLKSPSTGSPSRIPWLPLNQKLSKNPEGALGFANRISQLLQPSVVL